MRELHDLHVVGTDADGALLLAASPDQPAAFRLRDTTVRTRRTQAPRVLRDPSPAQIQARLRAGVSAEAIARETGADVERVLRWAAPVQAEMDGVLRGALGAHVVDGERRSDRPLGQLVAAVVADTELVVEWHTTRRTDGRWRVLLRLLDDGAVRTASWVWDGRRQRLEAASGRARRLSFAD